MLRDAQIEFFPYTTVDELCDAIRGGLGAVVLPEEILTPENADRLSRVLEQQPPWSNLPFVVLTRPMTNTRQVSAARARLPGALLIERPVRIENLLSAIRSGLESRRRQYAPRGPAH